MKYKKGLEILKKNESRIEPELYRIAGENMLADVFEIIEKCGVDSCYTDSDDDCEFKYRDDPSSLDWIIDQITKGELKKRLGELKK